MAVFFVSLLYQARTYFEQNTCHARGAWQINRFAIGNGFHLSAERGT